jgi:hypothetical protein
MRMMGALLLKTASVSIAELFVPAGQHSVALPSGTDRDLKATTLNHEAGYSTILLDIRNTYNEVSRAAVLRAVAEHWPEALPLVAAQLAHHQGTLRFRHQDGRLKHF